MRAYLAFLIILSGGFASLSSFAAGPRVTSIEFKGTSDPSELNITTDGPVTVDKQVSTTDKQVVLNLPGATLSPGAKRSVDTSSFNGQVSLISPYQSTSDQPGVKIVIQLRSNVEVAMTQDDKKIHLTIPNQAAPASSDAADPALPASNDSTTSANAKNKPPASQEEMDRMLKGIASKEFTGKPITLQVRDLDIRDVFNLIAETSGFNIVLAPDVQGTITLSLVDVPWDQALDVVMQTMKLGADRKGNVLRVLTLDGLAKEIDLQQKLKIATEAVEPRKTEIFPISYAKLTDLANTISKLIGIETTPLSATPAQALSSTPGAQTTQGQPMIGMPATTAPAAAAATPYPQGTGGNAAANKYEPKVIIDDRTNSLIVWAIPSVMERIRKIIAVLDTQTPQILLEGKVVEASESFSRNIGGNLGLTNLGISGSVPYGASFVGSNLLSSPATLIAGLNGSSAGGSGAPSGGSFATSIIPFNQQINAVLNIGEAENKIKVISSPKEVVLNKQDAKIVQGTPVFIPTTGIGPAGGVVSTGSVVNANLSLDVTPTVTGDGSVLMDLTLSRDTPEALVGASSAGQEGVATADLTTHVLVDSGSTLVLGGFFTSSDQHSNSGFPFLRDIPILGWLFSSDTKATTHDELFFFITPTIVNPKKSGVQKS
jgi:type IV pilus assembly protein PilQ